MNIDNDDVIDRALRAVENNDIAKLSSIYAPGIRIWHNHDGMVQNREDNLATLAGLHLLGTLKYHVLERLHSGEHTAQRHELVITSKDGGKEYRLGAAIFFTIKGGLIAAFDEYMDSRQLEIVAAAIHAVLQKSARS